MLKLYQHNLTPAQYAAGEGMICTLPNASAPEVAQAINGDWSLRFAYPAGDLAAEQLTLDCLVEADGQLYRIESREKVGGGEGEQLQIHAVHLIYDLRRKHIVNIETSETTPGGISQAVALDQILQGTPFTRGTVDTDPLMDYLDILQKDAMWALKEQVLPLWGGELQPDNWTVHIRKSLGANRGAQLRYGKNINGVKLRESLDGTITRLHILGYRGANIEPINAGKDYIDSPHIGLYAQPLEGMVTFHDDDLPEDLLSKGQAYLATVDTPRISMSVDLLRLRGSVQYRHYQDLETIGLGDTVTVYHQRLKINIEARIQTRTYDPLTGENLKVELGNDDRNLYSHIASLQQAMELVQQIADRKGHLRGEKLRGVVDLLTTRLYASGAYTHAVVNDQHGLLFENTDETSVDYGAMYIGPGIFAIANSKKADGSWDWRTFGTGKGFAGSELIAHSITANHLASDVGEHLDLSSNTMISQIVETLDDPDTGLAAVNTALENVEQQLDGKIETYNQTTDPAGEWSTPELKAAHSGDLWYNPGTKETKRWNGSAWIKLLSDEAAAAQALAEKKRRVFVAQPVPPYDVGDLWLTSITAGQADLMTCITARASGEYVAADWREVVKYTDDSYASTKYQQTNSAFRWLMGYGAAANLDINNAQTYLGLNESGLKFIGDNVDLSANETIALQIENMRLSGANLLSNSGNLEGIDGDSLPAGWSTYLATVAALYYNDPWGYKYMYLDKDPVGTYHLYTTGQDLGKFYVGEQYTVSFYCLDNNVFPECSIKKMNEWSKQALSFGQMTRKGVVNGLSYYEATATVTSEQLADMSLVLAVNQRWIRITRIMLERSNKASAWQPSSRDVQRRLSTLSITLDAAQEAITQKAERTVTDGHATRLNSVEQKTTPDWVTTAVRNHSLYQADLNNKNRTYLLPTAPSGAVTGDLWIDQSNGNLLKRWSGNSWDPVQDGAISLAQQEASKIAWLISSGDSASNMVLTERLYQLMTERVMIAAQEQINIAVGGVKPGARNYFVNSRRVPTSWSHANGRMVSSEPGFTMRAGRTYYVTMHARTTGGASYRLWGTYNGSEWGWSHTLNYGRFAGDELKTTKITPSIDVLNPRIERSGSDGVNDWYIYDWAILEETTNPSTDWYAADSDPVGSLKAAGIEIGPGTYKHWAAPGSENEIGVDNTRSDKLWQWAGGSPSNAKIRMWMDGTARFDQLLLGNSGANLLTQMYPYADADNADADNSMILKVFVPAECAGVQSLKLSFALEAFRAYSKAAASGGGSTETSGGESTDVTAGSAEYTGGGTTDGGGNTGFAGGHSHEFAGSTTSHVSDHRHTYPAHKHYMGHAHAFPHTHSVPNKAHTHGITYGIYKGATATSCQVIVDGTNIGSFASLTARDITAQLTKASGKVTRDTWHTIEIKPDGMTRIVAQAFLVAVVATATNAIY